MKHKGIIFGILAAVCYGTNPFGALPLYEEGVNTASVLFYRFFMAVLMLAIMLTVQRLSFSVSKGELKVLGSLGMLFAASSITYYQSFHFMDAGIASTILFVYPVMVAIIMTSFFKEKVTASTITSIILALVGIGLLYRGDAGISLSTMGVLLVMLSSLTYAVYIVIVNQSSIRMSSLKLTFYVLLICMLCLLAYSFTSPDLHLMLPPSPRAWFFACWLGLVPTVLSLVFMTIAVHEVGATPTAIMGALEPLTAVAIGVMVFDESLTFRLAVGIVLILSAVLLIVMGKSFHLRAHFSDSSRMEKQSEGMKKAIVVGASSGIGMEVARLLLKQGWKVGVAARRVDLLKTIGDVETEQIDVTKPEATQQLQHLIERVGGMDLFFYASGIGKQNRELKEDMELATVETNAVGFTRMIGEAYRFFAQQGYGHIAAISSIAGTKGLGPAPSYSATKALQNVYLQALEQQANARGLNICFTDIRPGFVDTALLNGNFKYPMMLKPEAVAKEIVHAINRKQHVRIIDWKYRILTALWRRIPKCIWRHLKL